MTVVISYKGD